MSPTSPSRMRCKQPATFCSLPAGKAELPQAQQAVAPGANSAELEGAESADPQGSEGARPGTGVVCPHPVFSGD